jgi:type IX secretion system PorP/SprF family membrane protein
MRTTLPSYLGAFLLLLVVSVSSAQDPHFSQFYNAPLHLNPALVGVFDGQFRVATNYRNQWSSILGADAFKTLHAGADMRMRVFQNDYFTAGLNVLQDQAGAGAFKRGHTALTAGYQKQLSGSKYRRDHQYLTVGLQAGFGQFSHDWGNYWFSNQYNPITESVDPGAPSGELLADNTGLFLDISAGLMYYAVFDKDASVYVGGAIMHANQPGISFLNDGSETLYQKLVFHAGGQIPFNPNFSILPAAYIAFQGPSSQMVLGNNFRLTNNDWYEVAIRAGLWTRLSNRLDSGKVMDALIYSFTLEMERWQLGLSYDVNHSSLRTATSGRGGFEISLIYIHPTQSRYRVNCPRF